MMNANLSRREREVSLILNDSGGAEVIDHGTGQPLWASDSDEDFREDFPDLLDDEDIEDVLDYLVAHDVLTEVEADEAEILKAEAGPGDEDDDDDEDESDVDNGDEDENEDEE